MKKHLLMTLCAVAFCLTGCFQTKSTDSMTVLIRSTKHTNRGTPLYIVIKETSMADFLLDDYHKITTQSFWKEDDKDYLTKKVLVPGKTDKIKLDIPSNDKSVGIYFIFTNPGECWKYIVDQPQMKNVKILLGKDQYDAINVYQS